MEGHRHVNGFAARPPFDAELKAGLAVVGGVFPPTITPDLIPFMRRSYASPPLEEILHTFPEVDVTHETVPGHLGDEIAASVFRSQRATGARPVIVYAHSGGLMFGDRFNALDLCLVWVTRFGATLVTFDYRLAPEYPDPYPREDTYAVLEWTARHAGRLGVDPSRIVIAGASAGGGLAAGTALAARDRDGPKLHGQLLIYPMLDDRGTRHGHFAWNRGRARQAHDRRGADPRCGRRRGDRHGRPRARGRDLSAIADAYLTQLAEVEDAGGRVVLMASRQLARAAAGPEDYLRVYGRVLSAARNPVVLHWLGDMFDPALTGYWGSESVDAATETVLSLIAEHADVVDGIKVSLLDEDFEVALRRRLPAGVRLYTGDDFNYVELIAGDDVGHSDALLGAFAAVPRFASAAFHALDGGDVEAFRSILDPTQELSRKIFEAPTQFYKVGVVWLSFLTGWQSHVRMLAGFETGRSLLHLADLFVLANEIGLFPDPDLAAARAGAYFRGQGIDG